MFRMLVFLIAFPHWLAMAWLGLVCLSSGEISQGLPFWAVCLMCASYFFKGALETVEYIRSRIK